MSYLFWSHSPYVLLSIEYALVELEERDDSQVTNRLNIIYHVGMPLSGNHVRLGTEPNDF